MSDTDTPPEYLTTKEVAALLRVRERRVYELASAGDIPCRRVIGKLLFPHAEITAWLNGGEPVPQVKTASLPPIVAGSHDPLLDWAIRESRSGLATNFDGSLDGVQQLAEGAALAAGAHIFVPEDNDWNTTPVSSVLGNKSVVMVEWARRQQGIILSKDCKDSVKSVIDLKGRRVLKRQTTAGAAILFDHLAEVNGLIDEDFDSCQELARTETEAASSVAAGKADAAPGLEAVAKQFDLGFLPTKQEIFDLIVYRRAWFDPPVQRLLAFTRTPAFQSRAAELGGYDVSRLGTVRWNSP